MRGQQLTLVVMSADGQLARSGRGQRPSCGPGWLNSTTWGLLILGSVILLLGIAVLAWPARTREVVYVVDPAQVPEIAARLGVPVPSSPRRRGSTGCRSRADPPAAVRGPRPCRLARPATLAESAPAASGAAPVGRPGAPLAGHAATSPGAPLPRVGRRSSERRRTAESPDAEPRDRRTRIAAASPVGAGSTEVAPVGAGAAPAGAGPADEVARSRPGPPRLRLAGRGGRRWSLDAALREGRGGSDGESPDARRGRRLRPRSGRSPTSPRAGAAGVGGRTTTPSAADARRPPRRARHRGALRRRRRSGPRGASARRVGHRRIGGRGNERRQRSAPAARTAVDQPVTVGPAHGSGAAAAHAAAAAMSAAAPVPPHPGRPRGPSRSSPTRRPARPPRHQWTNRRPRPADPRRYMEVAASAGPGGGNFQYADQERLAPRVCRRGGPLSPGERCVGLRPVTPTIIRSTPTW